MTRPRPRAAAGPRHVLVIGASRGVGAEVRGALEAAGARVSSAGRTRPRAWDGWHVDVDVPTAQWSDVYAAAERAASAPLDGIVFVPGDAVFGRTGAIPIARARESFELNFWATARAALDAEALWTPADRRGAFVSVSSVSARRAVPFEAFYCASKAATARFLDALALEHPDGRIRFGSVYPGRLRTDFRRAVAWYGVAREAPEAEGTGGDPATVAAAVVDVLRARRDGPVIGWRERAIDAVDRVSPRLYDRLVLAGRVRRKQRAT